MARSHKCLHLKMSHISDDCNKGRFFNFPSLPLAFLVAGYPAAYARPLAGSARPGMVQKSVEEEGDVSDGVSSIPLNVGSGIGRIHSLT